MDLKQTKLTKSEWDSLEIPVTDKEKEVLSLLTSGYNDVNIKINKTDSLFTYLKIEFNTEIEEFLFNKYFGDNLKELVKKYNLTYIKFEKPRGGSDKSRKATDTNALVNTSVDSTKELDSKSTDQIVCYVNISKNIKLKTKDQIRIGRIDNIDPKTSDIYEFILYDHFEKMIMERSKSNKHWMFHFYTLRKLLANSIDKLNTHLKNIITSVLDIIDNEVDLVYIVENSVEFIEKNTHLLKYNDMTLYDHQKEIFTAVKVKSSKLILYIAPTGTGKTMTPIGLSEEYRVIFVCAARHVGLALARAAISANKKIAFAFGCSSAEDVRLHYFAAADYTINKRTGGIGKVDNTNGRKVEIMICDIRSYIPAMYYMLAFNNASDIIVQWDEPTITMDYKTHPLHSIIKYNWSKNLIFNMILSSATLPKEHELTHTITDFRAKIPATKRAPRIFNIVSHDCKKTIPIINNNGFVVMPHHRSPNYEEILKVAEHCDENLTLLRYFDLKEASNFIMYIDQNSSFIKSSARFSRNFASVDDINMTSIKLHYLKVLKNIVPECWAGIYEYFTNSSRPRIMPNSVVDSTGNKISKSSSVGPGTTYRTGATNMMNNAKNGTPLSRLVSEQQSMSLPIPRAEPNGSCAIYVTTRDAYTLTDGPTIFLANDVQKVAKFCIQQANIPLIIMKDITEKIEFNNAVNEKISSLEHIIAFEEEKITNKLFGSTGMSTKTKEKKSKLKIASNMIDRSVATEGNQSIEKMRIQIEELKGMIKNASLNDVFVPNKLAHIDKWANGINTKSSFTSNISDETIASIMLLKDVEDSWKVLLLLGIGVFTEHKSIAYTEIMKKLADNQTLYLIIADSDYIYGTNYQFCHGYLSKDLNMTQEKIIQALGRIGRSNIQQEYSARFRDDEQIKTLFTKFRSEDKPEVLNMNILFNSNNVQWNAESSCYEEVSDKVIDSLAELQNVQDDELVLEDADDDDDDDDNSDEVACCAENE
jgi:hypothetical protein